jgi:CubicO group peptidase (beta-lactamase class C family)
LDAGKKRCEKVPAARKITIQDLFRHTSGLSYGNSGATVLHKMYPVSSGTASQTLSGSEFLDRLSSLPLVYQPGTVWEYGFGLDVLGLVVESITEQPHGQYRQENLWIPLGMSDTGLSFQPKRGALQSTVQRSVTGRATAATLFSVFDCGGKRGFHEVITCASLHAVGTALGDARVAKTVEYMLSNQLGPAVRTQLRNSGSIHGDYGFGLSVAVRVTPGIASSTGSVGDFSWPGAFGTYWWGDPREELAVVWMTQTPGSARGKYQRMIRAMVNEAITD